MVVGSGYASIAVAVGLRSGTEAATSLSAVYALLLFTNGGFVPVEGFPDWIQPIVRINPLTLAVETLAGLSTGGPVLRLMLGTVGWTLLAWGLAVPLAIRVLRSSGA